MPSPSAVCANLGDSPLDMDYINHSMKFTPSECCTISCGTVCVDPRASRVLVIYNRRLGIWQLPKGRKNIGEDLESAALRETYEETGVHAVLLPLKIRTRSTNPPFIDSKQQGTSADKRLNGKAHNRVSLSMASISSASTAWSTSLASTTSPGCMSLNAPLHSEGSAGVPVNDALSPHDKGPAASLIEPDVNQKDVDVDSLSESDPDASQDSPGHGTVTAAPSVLDPKLISDLFNSEMVGIVQYPDLQAETPNTVKTVFFYAALADSTMPMGDGAQEEHEDLLAEWVDFYVADERLRFGPEKEVMWKVWRDMKRSGIKC